MINNTTGGTIRGNIVADPAKAYGLRPEGTIVLLGDVGINYYWRVGASGMQRSTK